jgi:L-ascorbate metabolism protein UlaG (beta-lactamase superfamily)
MHSHLRFLIAAAVLFAAGCAAPPAAVADQPGDRIPAEKGDILVYPVEHASLVLQWNEKTIYVDPVGGAERYAQLPKPDLVLVTHEHFDHFDVATLKGLIPAASKAKIVAPKSVVEKLPSGSLADRATVVAAGDKIEAAGVPIEAVPAYNTTPERQSFHPKGRDVGYVIQLGGKRIYVAGDTENTPEMRKLKNIDAAFLPMNLPYTMDIEQAANAVREFKPKIVYPYHFRSRDKTKPDFDKLKKLIGADSGVEVRVLKWY